MLVCQYEIKHAKVTCFLNNFTNNVRNIHIKQKIKNVKIK